MRSTLVVLLLVTISLLWGVEAARNAGLSTSISESDLNEIKNVVLANKDWSSNLNTAYYLTSTLANLEKSQQAEVATLAKNTLKSKDKSLEAIFQAASIAETLKLNDVTVDKSVVDAIKKAIDAGESLTDLYYAGSAALSLRALKLAKEITDDDLSKIVSAVADFAEEDGTFRSSASDKEGSLYNSGLALQVIARLVKDTKLPEEEKERVDEVVDKVESIISLANEEQNQLEFPGDDSANSLATTSAVFVGLNALAAATKKPLPEVSATQVAQIGQYLVNQKKVGDIKDAFHLLNGVRTLTNNVIAIPLAVSLERASIVGTAKGSEGQVRVKVTDALDKPITAAKVVLIKAQPASGKDTHVLLSNQELSLSDDKKTFALNFLAAKPEQGFYNLEFRVVPTDAKTYTTVDSATRSVKVVGSISITDLEIAIADSKEALNKHSEGGLYKAADQSKKIDDVIRIDHLQFVNVKFRVRGAGGSNKPVLVQQAFVKLVHKSGHEAIFVAQPNENKIYSVVIDVDEASKSQFKSQSGDYKLEIVAGDAFIQNPVHWVAAPNVKLTLANAATSSKNALGPLPEIKHAFRKPEPRPPVAVSNVATLIVLSPILFLLIGFIAVGANISQFPFTGMDFIYAVGFLASIGATLGLMGLYWLKLNLVQTLGYLAVLAVPNVFFGQRALSRLAKRKDKTEKSD